MTRKNRFARYFDAAERETIRDALTGHLTMIDSFLSDAEGDDVDSVRDDRKMVVALIDEFTK